MRKVKFEAEGLMMIALFKGESRKDTIRILENMMKVLVDTRGNDANEELVKLVTSTVDKLRMVGDTTYDSLDLEYYVQDWEEQEYDS